MPIYEYQCSACGATFEFIQKVSDEPKTFCDNCQKDTLKKLVSAPQFKLKGTGWYETDFKNKPKAKASGQKAASQSTSATPASQSANTSAKAKSKDSATK